jgi:hypothetical protein
MPIVSMKQLHKLSKLTSKGKIKREVFNGMIDDTKDITKLPLTKQLIKKGK